MLIGNDAYPRPDQRLIIDIYTAGTIDNTEVIDFHSITEPNATRAALHVGVAIDCHTVAKSDTDATRGINRSISMNFTFLS